METINKESFTSVDFINLLMEGKSLEADQMFRQMMESEVDSHMEELVQESIGSMFKKAARNFNYVLDKQSTLHSSRHGDFHYHTTRVGDDQSAAYKTHILGPNGPVGTVGHTRSFGGLHGIGKEVDKLSSEQRAGFNKHLDTFKQF